MSAPPDRHRLRVPARPKHAPPRRAEPLERRDARRAALARPGSPAPTVTHPKFGTGMVESADGSGEGAKLTLRFGREKKVLLAKFVKRA